MSTENNDSENTEDNIEIEVKNTQSVREKAKAEAKKAKEAMATKDVRMLEKEVNELTQKLEKAQADAEESRKKAQYAMAEAQNTLRRSEKSIADAHKYGTEKFAKELLDVVDGLERGLEAANADTASVESIKEGMDLTYKMILNMLDKFNIKQINPQGEDFNPACHEALTMQVSDEVAPNKVLTVIQPGFSIGDRVLRHAKVIVAKAGENNSPKIDEKA